MYGCESSYMKEDDISAPFRIKRISEGIFPNPTEIFINERILPWIMHKSVNIKL